jgi:hypothetical protein
LKKPQHPKPDDLNGNGTFASTGGEYIYTVVIDVVGRVGSLEGQIKLILAGLVVIIGFLAETRFR